MKIIFLSSFFLFIISSSIAFCDNKEIPFFEEQFMGVALGTDTQKALEVKLGKGETFGVMSNMVCYYNEQLDQRVIFSSREDKLINSVNVISSSEKLWQDCRQAFLNKTPETPKGITLGASKQFVISLYGEPQSKSFGKNGDELFEYHATDKDDPRIDYNFDSYLTFRGDTLVGFSISHGP